MKTLKTSLILLTVSLLKSNLVWSQKLISDSLLHIVKLIYNSSTTDFFITAKLKKGYEKVFGVRCQELVENLESVSLNLKNNQNRLPYNFRFFQSGLPWGVTSGNVIFLLFMLILCPYYKK